jgi:hypothetical protein
VTIRALSVFGFAFLLGCGFGEEAPGAKPAGGPGSAATWFEPATSGAFIGHAGPSWSPGFDAVAADFDLDNDPDLLINWHHLGALELFENRSGVFSLINASGRDRSGIHDVRGVESLYAPADVLPERIDASGTRGLHVWHEPARIGSWRFAWRGGDGEALRVQLETSRRFDNPKGLQATDYVRLARNRLVIEIDDAHRDFEIRARPVGALFSIQMDDPVSRPATALHIGSPMTPWAERSAQLWKADPHGLAWVHTEGSRRPELYIARGGQLGTLRPPHPPKRDRYFLAQTDGDPLYRFAPIDVVPANYARGRRVEWVGIDNDGRLELSIASKGGPHGLLVRQPDGTLRDRAAYTGSDAVRSEATAWVDVDGDGFDDLVFLVAGAVPGTSTIGVAMNRRGHAFDLLNGQHIGLQLAAESGEKEAIFEKANLRVADFDNDGDLDLWVLGYGANRTALSTHTKAVDMSRSRKRLELLGPATT